MHEQARSTAELIVECLENEGVMHVFGIPGMAEAYGRLTGRAGVCSATLGRRVAAGAKGRAGR